jgi:hypothetical protein
MLFLVQKWCRNGAILRRAPGKSPERSRGDSNSGFADGDAHFLLPSKELYREEVDST